MTKKERSKIRAEIRAEMKSKKLTKSDGLGPYEIKKVRSALRVVWQRSHARLLVVLRCTDAHGFARCEQCGHRTPKLKVDHIEPCGELNGGYLKRLFCPSSQLQGLCHNCHCLKTKVERQSTRVKKKWGF